MASGVADGTTPDTAVNWIDIKLHSVTNVPKGWLSESGNAPLYSDHIFRYELDVTVGEQKQTFRNGRLLQPISQYAEFIDAAKMPPPTQAENEKLPLDVPSDQPVAVPIPPTNSAPEPPVTPRSEGPVLLWVLGTEVDASEAKEETVKKHDQKAAKGKGAPPPTTQPTHEIAKPPPPPTTPPICLVRIPLNMEQLSHLEEAVEKFVPLTLNFRRVLRPNCPNEWEDTQEAKYQATLSLSLKALTEPGSTQFTTTVPLKPSIPEGAKEDERKGKKAQPKKSRGTVPACLLEELDLSEPHPYVSTQTSAVITVYCHQAITRLPQARPRPDLQPADMIPMRLRPPRRPVEATKQYSKEVEGIVLKIAQAYRQHLREKREKGEEPGGETSFIEFLQTSGQAHAFKELLVPSVQGIVKEKFLRKVNPTKQDLDRVSNELYTYLLDHMHLSLNRVFSKSAQATPAALDGNPAARWKRLAMEAEVMGEFAVAAKYHQERLVQFEDELPEIWCEYAEFCLRVRDVLKAEQGYREALALDFAHLPSLIGYGILLLSRGRFKEAEVFLQSAVDIASNSITWGMLALYFDMLLLQLQDTPEDEAKKSICRRESKHALTQAVRTNESPQCTVEDIYLLLAGHLLNLYQEELASQCLSKLPSSAAVNCLYAKMFFHTQQYDDAVPILKPMIQDNPQNCEARMLLGDVYAAMMNSTDAELQYDAALRVNPQCGDGPAYIRLGNIYTALGKFKDALGAFLISAKIWPCGLSWLGVGIAYYRLDDMVHAEQALNESNVLNNLNPKTWAYLALVCLRVKREDEGQEAFNQAIKQGLADPYLIAEVGAEQARQGRHSIAEACFRRSLALRDDCNTRMHLARALMMMRRLPEAKEQFQLVADSTTNETQKARALEQIQLIPASGAA